MIISFNPSIFQNQDDAIRNALANILRELMKTSIHFIDTKSINTVFYDENGKYIFNSNLISEHLSSREQKNLPEFLSKASRINITSLHRKHLVTITVGIDEINEEVHPQNLYRIITERSKIIVENGINDGKFIQGICQKYSSFKKNERWSIYQLIDRAIKDGIIESQHSGGIGEITKAARHWICANRYKNIFRYKLMAIFDSDRESSNELTRHKDKVKFFKKRNIFSNTDCNYEHTDLIVWHILYKKKIENYIPQDVLIRSLSLKQEQKDALTAKTDEELDFMEYDFSNIGLGKDQIKDKFPEMFLSNFSYRDFEERCKHHKVFLEETGEISEIEQILLKIAKIL